MFRPVQYAHWHQFFENISVSSLEFYNSLSRELSERRLPKTTLSRIDFSEGGMLTQKRIYLCIERDWLIYHVCVAPFGTGFFVSSRLFIWPWRRWFFVALVTVFYVVSLGASSWIVIDRTNLFFGLIASIVFGVPLLLLLLVALILWVIKCLHLTYYRLDTMLAFHEAVHRVLVSQVNQLIEPSGHKPLSETESKPILHKLLQG